MSNNPQNSKSNAALREEAVLQFWKENKIFEKSLEKDAPSGDFVFYEGPPTANAKPALHHLESRAFKDVIPRYKTMQGYRVARRAGWDTHGLPVELQIEKKLGLTSKKDIEKYGIAQFNKECKDSVFTHIKDWEVFTDRIGYWVDQDNAYYTFNPSYMESLWSIMAHVSDRGLLYKDYRVVPWCARCGTALASHELAQGYQDDKDLSVTAKFKVKGQENTYLLAWTTTPWTLPGNVGLAVGKDIEYVKIKFKKDLGVKALEKKLGEKVGVLRQIDEFNKNEILILAKERISGLTDLEYEIFEEVKGSDLVGLEYEPLYPYLATIITGPEQEKMSAAYKVYAADFVTTTDGTGIVHTAVMYGQEDFELGTKVGLPKFHTVDEMGKFVAGTDFLEGRFVKDEDVAVDIIKDLAHRGLLFKKEKYEHSYPHCWRCKTPLIYYARDSWYIRMEELRKELIPENQKINWEPEHIRDGRFGEWLKGDKDWAISRERYWGTPLPIWVSDAGERLVVDSVDTLKKYAKKSGNTYFVMRHGQAQTNEQDLLNCDIGNHVELVESGKEKAKESAQSLTDKKITKIFCSQLHRTQQTAEIVKETLGLDVEIVLDARLNETNFGDANNSSKYEFNNKYRKAKNFDLSPENGESLNDMRKRIGEFLYEIENTYKDENILIVSHGDPLWMIDTVAHGYDIDASYETALPRYIKTGEVRILDFAPLPHNDLYELDLHRPYIDSVVLHKDGKDYRRIKEVMDVWFDSGAMPFAQDHYPFEHKEDLKYPADFISEGIDQTRGWFYTLLAVGVLMGRGTPYRNVICLGHLLDKEGKKMSKSVGNIVEPFEQMDKFGVDAVRYWMYSVNAPGESKNYDEKSVAEINNKVFNLLGNVYAFYEQYRDTSLEKDLKESTHVLDTWITARLNQTVESVTKGLDAYDLFAPTRTLREFVDDLSTWYLRRSRDRLKDGDVNAKATLYKVIKTTAQLLAPFAPFFVEDLWLKLKSDNEEESVHLSVWPKAGKSDEIIIETMNHIREVVSEALKWRQKAGIRVRQPLALLAIKYQTTNIYHEENLMEIIRDEVNVKAIAPNFDAYEKETDGIVWLDTNITPELKLEGDYRELVRMIQDLRKEKGLMPADVISLSLPTKYQEIVDTFGEELKKTVGAKEISINGEEIGIQ
jgi:isoleucyl-tRNA synthetase